MKYKVYITSISGETEFFIVKDDQVYYWRPIRVKIMNVSKVNSGGLYVSNVVLKKRLSIKCIEELFMTKYYPHYHSEKNFLYGYKNSIVDSYEV